MSSVAASPKNRSQPLQAARTWFSLHPLVIPAIVFVLTCPPQSPAQLPATLRDFQLSGTQMGDVHPGSFYSVEQCRMCHGGFDAPREPFARWSGSLMGQAGRDPLFFAQMATANQDVQNVGYFCMRCHVPMTFVTGHAMPADGSALNSRDAEGVSCHFCHSMVDPRYQPGVSPLDDEAILADLDAAPQHYANAQFVLDPFGMRRGPRPDPDVMHEFIESPFHRTGEFCGTCHDVGNACVTRQPDGTYRYNALDTPTPTEDPHGQFPLERTYTEWKLSAFANGGVDMGGRFGGAGVTTVGTCQSCHMPRAAGRNSPFARERPDIAVHEFAGASAWVLETIERYWDGDPSVDPLDLQAGQAAARAMVQRAATVTQEQRAGTLCVRITNESGHKLPTGHIEGRRVWLNVRFFDAAGDLVGEHGRYDAATAELDEASTAVYEMKIGLSAYAASVTGLPAGETLHMSLADTIVKDSRIPPRGFDNAAYAAAGAPVVAWSYADGQHWDERNFRIPAGAVRAVSTAYYQTVTAHYIEGLRHGNHTDHWGETLYQLWEQTGRCPPIAIHSAATTLAGFRRADMNMDGAISADDVDGFVTALVSADLFALRFPHSELYHGDVNGDGAVNFDDIDGFVVCLLAGACP